MNKLTIVGAIVGVMIMSSMFLPIQNKFQFSNYVADAIDSEDILSYENAFVLVNVRTPQNHKTRSNYTFNYSVIQNNLGNEGLFEPAGSEDQLMNCSICYFQNSHLQRECERVISLHCDWESLSQLVDKKSMNQSFENLFQYGRIAELEQNSDSCKL